MSGELFYCSPTIGSYIRASRGNSIGPAMSAARELTAAGALEVALARGHASAALWRSLHYFNVYRLIAAALLLHDGSGGRSEPAVRRAQLRAVHARGGGAVRSAAFSGSFSYGPAGASSSSWESRCSWTSASTALLTYASHGITSGLGLLLLTTLAGRRTREPRQAHAVLRRARDDRDPARAHDRGAAIRGADGVVRAGGPALRGVTSRSHGSRTSSRSTRSRARSSRRSARSISRTWRT